MRLSLSLAAVTSVLLVGLHVSTPDLLRAALQRWTVPDGSCQAYGCHTRYNKTHSCQCNDACKDHGDCCSDFSTTCNKENCPFAIRASAADLARATKAKATARHLTAASPQEIAEKLNGQLPANRPCDQFSSTELNALFESMWCHRSEDLALRYAGLDGRKLAHGSLDGYRGQWAQEGDSPAVRDAKCAHTTMFYTHHLTAESKEKFMATGPAFPTLPAYDASAGHDKTSFTCVTGHNNTGRDSDHVWPHWPAEAHYFATGHGAYPFWLGPSGSGGTSKLEVWWSQPKAAEKFYHETCGIGEAGYTKDSAPCYHLMLGHASSPVSYLYTADEDFCCLSQPSGAPFSPPPAPPSPAPGRRLQGPPGPPPGPSGQAEFLTAVQSDWMDAMTYEGTKQLTTEYFSGQAKYYTMALPDSEPVGFFWYYTTTDGRPVQQGEGGHGGAGIKIFHDYNTSSFRAADLADDVFAVPGVCKQTRTTCAFP